MRNHPSLMERAGGMICENTTKYPMNQSPVNPPSPLNTSLPPNHSKTAITVNDTVSETGEERYLALVQSAHQLEKRWFDALNGGENGLPREMP